MSGLRPTVRVLGLLFTLPPPGVKTSASPSEDTPADSQLEGTGSPDKS